ncbi:MAG: hypothetical protein COB04_16155 [Gammaproteobacteria bacterium]|nr:MAG: hypothetical protein COB04_16155 [Gammaproteobacteria bacterium]
MSKASRFKIAARYELPPEVLEELHIQKYAALIVGVLKPCSELRGAPALQSAAAILANNVSHKQLSDDVKIRIVVQVLNVLCEDFQEGSAEHLRSHLEVLFQEIPRVSFYRLTRARAWNLLKNVARKL